MSHHPIVPVAVPGDFAHIEAGPTFTHRATLYGRYHHVPVRMDREGRTTYWWSQFQLNLAIVHPNADVTNAVPIAPADAEAEVTL
jgi:hypothetical protein